MSKQDEVLKALESVNAVITGSHIIYTSGKHGSAYVNKDAIYPHTQLISDLCKNLAEQVASQKIDVVVAPVIGGVILSQWIAFHLSKIQNKEVLAAYAEKTENGFVLQRGYDELVRGKKVLIAEDILNTGGSVRKVVDTVNELGAEIVAIVALCNRGGVKAVDLGVDPSKTKLISLLDVSLEAWSPDECPLCKQGIPINTKVGKGKK